MNVTPTSNTPQITTKEKKRVRQVTSINVINIVKFELLLNPLVTTIFYFIYKIQLPGFKNDLQFLCSNLLVTDLSFTNTPNAGIKRY